MSDNNGIGLTGVLLIVFLVLKLTGNIAWSWWWVTSPVWIPAAGLFVIILGAGLLAVIRLVSLWVVQVWRDR